MKNRRAPSEASIRYSPPDRLTKVIRAMHDNMVAMMTRVLAGWFELLMNRMVGRQFDRGLAALKIELEAA